MTLRDLLREIRLYFGVTFLGWAFALLNKESSAETLRLSVSYTSSLVEDHERLDKLHKARKAARSRSLFPPREWMR